MSKKARLIAAILLLLVLAGGGWLYARQAAMRGGPALTFYGDVDIREVQPTFNASGHIASMPVQEGAVVHRGELLARLDDTRYAASLAQAKATAQNLKAALDKLLAGSRPDEIAQAKATMDALRITYRNDEVRYRRYAALAVTHAATLQQRDDARAAFEAAGQQYAAAQQAYILALKGPRQEDIDAARAAYAAATAAVALAQRAYDDTSLHAPADGVIEDRILEPGDMASPSVPVFTMALTSPLWVRAYVPESELGRIRYGMAATVTTDSEPGTVYHGWVGYLSPTAEFTPKTVETPGLRTALVYQMRVYVCDPRDQLRLGMPATVHIDPQQAPPPARPGCGGGHAGGG